MERIIKNIKNADAYTKATIAPFAIIGTGALVTAIFAPFSLAIAAVCYGLCAVAYNDRYN